MQTLTRVEAYLGLVWHVGINIVFSSFVINIFKHKEKRRMVYIPPIYPFPRLIVVNIFTMSASSIFLSKYSK